MVTKCPFCGKENDRQTNLTDEGKEPNNGDLSICICCYRVSKYQKIEQEEIELVPLDMNELKESDPETFELLRNYQISLFKAKISLQDGE